MSLALITFTISLFSLTVFLGIKRLEHTRGKIIVPQRAFTKSDHFFRRLLSKIKKFFRICFRLLARLGLILHKGMRKIRLAVATQIFALAELIGDKSEGDTFQSRDDSAEN